MAAHADLTEEEVWGMEEDDLINDSRSSSDNGNDGINGDTAEDDMVDDFVSLGRASATDRFPIHAKRPPGWQDDGGFDIHTGVRRGSGGPGLTAFSPGFSPLASSLPIAVPQFMSNTTLSQHSDSLERPATPTASTFDRRPGACLPRGHSPPGGTSSGFMSKSYQPVPFGGKRMPFSPDSTEDPDDFVPPHVLSSLPRGSNSLVGYGQGPLCQLSSTCPQQSYLEESVVGRPGKGRDAIKVRNAIFKQTGFTAI